MRMQPTSLANGLPSKLPGKRTTLELAKAAVPARVYVILACLAILAATGMTLLAGLMQRVGPSWLAQEANNYATTFRAMPLWFLIGGSMSQLAARMGVAMDDLLSWWRSAND